MTIISKRTVKAPYAETLEPTNEYEAIEKEEKDISWSEFDYPNLQTTEYNAKKREWTLTVEDLSEGKNNARS